MCNLCIESVNRLKIEDFVAFHDLIDKQDKNEKDRIGFFIIATVHEATQLWVADEFQKYVNYEENRKRWIADYTKSQ